MDKNLDLKKYVKPSLEFVELRVEERLARCFNQEHKHLHSLRENNGHGAHIPGCHPGCVYHCPHS